MGLIRRDGENARSVPKRRRVRRPLIKLELKPAKLLQHRLPGPFIMRWIAIFLPLVVATTANATERFEFLIDKTLDPIEVALATTHRLAIRIDDKVTGGCWQNPNAVRVLVEQELQSKGFEVVDEGGIDGILRIRGLGRLITVGDQEIGCVVIINSSLKNAGLISIPLASQGSPPAVRFNYQNYESWESLHHILEEKGAMDNVVKRTAALHVQALMNQIFRARTKIFSAHPEIESKFQARISNEP